MITAPFVAVFWASVLLLGGIAGLCFVLGLRDAR